MMDNYGLLVLLGPGLAMCLGSVCALGLRIPDKLQACTQNFSAGLLLSAIAGELYPLMSPPSLDNASCSLAISVGFAAALAFMFSLERLTESDDGEGANEGQLESPRASLSMPMLEGDEEARVLSGFCTLAGRLKADICRLKESIDNGLRDEIDSVVHEVLVSVHKADRQLSLTSPLSERDLCRMKYHCDELTRQGEALSCKSTLSDQRRALKLFAGTLEHIHEHAERKRFQRWKPVPLQHEDFERKGSKTPWKLVASVSADGAVDGLLIGLAYAASPGAGLAMSIATCIEMGFLGLSFCATISNATRSALRRSTLMMVPPITLVASGLIGMAAGDAFQENPAAFVGFIGFSIVCLLFLVTQELLAKAREAADESAIVSTTLFLGLLSGIVLGKFVG